MESNVERESKSARILAYTVITLAGLGVFTVLIALAYFIVSRAGCP